MQKRFHPERDTLTGDELLKRVTTRYKQSAGDILAAYRREYPEQSPFGLWAAISAAGMRQNAITQAERKAAQGSGPAYMCLYAWRTPALGGQIGTFHSSELTFVFDNATLCTHYSATIRAESRFRRWANPGLFSRARATPATADCRCGPHLRERRPQQCFSMRLAP